MSDISAAPDSTYDLQVAPADNFRPVPRSKVYTDIVEQIMENIRSGTFPPGDRLPPERLLSDRFGVSRSSLREAVRVLEHAGVLDVRAGSGTYVTHESLTAAAALRTRATLLGEHSPLDLMIARIAVEPVAAELAAEFAYSKDIHNLFDSLAQHRTAIDRGEDPSGPDAAFHVAVARASHNDALIDIENYFVDLMHQRTWSDLKLKSRSVHNELYLQHHIEVSNAIKARDQRAARTAMFEHLVIVRSDLAHQVPTIRGTTPSQDGTPPIPVDE